MKGMAAMKYHFMLGLVENVSTFIPISSVFLLVLSRSDRGLRTKKAHDERQGEEYECNPTQPPHCSHQYTSSHLILWERDLTANA